MMVSALRIENVRCYAESQAAVNIIFSGPNGKIPRWIVIAGRNGAGKSTFLQAIALTIAGPSVARVMAESFAGWITNGAEEALTAVQLQFSEVDSLSGSGQRPKFSPWAALKWVRQESGPEPSVSSGKVGGNWNAARGPWSENPRGWFLAGYGPFRRLSIASSEVQRLMMSPGRPSALASLFREGASLSEAVVWLQYIHFRRLEGITGVDETEKLVLKLLNDGLFPEGMQVVSVSSDGLLVKTPVGAELLLRSMSDGYRTVTALVLDIIKQLVDVYGKLDTQDGDRVVILNDGVVLIDEIDVHLHVSWQQQIGGWLKTHFPNLQFIVTTHSPFICQTADEGGLVRLPAPGEEAPAEIVTGELFKRVVNGSADDAVISDLFGLESSYSNRSVKIRQELAELEATVSVTNNINGKDQNRIVELRDSLPLTPSDDVATALKNLAMEIRG